MVDWGTALQVFVFGFGGVFLCLTLLTIGIYLSGLILRTLGGTKK